MSENKVPEFTGTTATAWKLMQAHWAKAKRGETPFKGLASFVLNPALRQVHPEVDVKTACAPIVEAGLAHTRPCKGGVLYFEGKGVKAQAVEDLLKDAGLS